jgi:hypothetical protein
LRVPTLCPTANEEFFHFLKFVLTN